MTTAQKNYLLYGTIRKQDKKQAKTQTQNKGITNHRQEKITWYKETNKRKPKLSTKNNGLRLSITSKKGF